MEIALKLAGMKASERHQALTIEVEPSCPPLFADERALKQVLINLVSNAVKFTPEGGRIDVVASAARDGGFQIMVRTMAPAFRTRSWIRFSRRSARSTIATTARAAAPDLGLALVRGLTELHGGRAWIESQEGAGCSAFVVLPVKAPARAAAFA